MLSGLQKMSLNSQPRDAAGNNCVRVSASVVFQLTAARCGWEICERECDAVDVSTHSRAMRLAKNRLDGRCSGASFNSQPRDAAGGKHFANNVMTACFNSQPRDAAGSHS